MHFYKQYNMHSDIETLLSIHMITVVQMGRKSVKEFGSLLPTERERERENVTLDP